MSDITNTDGNTLLTRFASAISSSILMAVLPVGAALAQATTPAQPAPAVAAGIKDGAANWKLSEIQAPAPTPLKTLKDAAAALQNIDSHPQLGADGKPVLGTDGKPATAGLKPALELLDKTVQATAQRVNGTKPTPHMLGESMYDERAVGDEILKAANEFCATKLPNGPKEPATTVHPICATFTPEATDPAYQKGVWSADVVKARYDNGIHQLDTAMGAAAKEESAWTTGLSKGKDFFKAHIPINGQKVGQVDERTQTIVTAYAKLDAKVENLVATYVNQVGTLTEPAPPPPPVVVAPPAPAAPATPAEAKAQTLWKATLAHDVPATSFDARNHQLQLMVAKGAPTIANAATKATVDAVFALEAADLTRIVAAADKKAGTHLADEATPKAPGASGFQQLKLAARAMDDGAASFDAETQASLASSITHGMSVLHAAAPTAFPAVPGASPAHATQKKTSEVVFPREIFGARQDAVSNDLTAG